MFLPMLNTFPGILAKALIILPGIDAILPGKDLIKLAAPFIALPIPFLSPLKKFLIPLTNPFIKFLNQPQLSYNNVNAPKNGFTKNANMFFQLFLMKFIIP